MDCKHRLPSIWNRSHRLVLFLLSLVILIFFLRDHLIQKREHPIPHSTARTATKRGTHDDNYKVSEYKYTQTKSRNKEIQHIAFLKVHKAASSTIQNILYRFGSSRSLSFVLPYTTHHISKDDGNNYNPVLPPLDKLTGKYDILCNHVVFNQTKFKQLMYSDAVYLAIIREPFDQFISAAYYYRYVWPAEYLTGIPEKNFIHDLITKPIKYEPIRHSKTFNYMAFDFGYEIQSIQSVMNVKESAIAKFISKIADNFQFIMIVEYFDESLVMMKRFLNWSMKDILYTRQNEFKYGKHIDSLNVTDEDRRLFQTRNRLDHAIYDSFLVLFLSRMSDERDLADEVNEFRKILQAVRKFCAGNSSEKIVVLPSKWTDGFTLDKHDCQLMKIEEIPFWQILVHKHQSQLKILNT